MPRIIHLKEEKDRFDAMRAIQSETIRFQRWTYLVVSLIAFLIVWTCGAVVFWLLEPITYFQALYFGFCSLLTIGYGDITPQSNPGRPFFVAWSLIAVPTMTILISEMSDTVVASFEQATSLIADWTVLPHSGKYRAFLLRFPSLSNFLQRREQKKRLSQGFPVGMLSDDVELGRVRSGSTSHKPSPDRPVLTLEELARQPELSDLQLAQRLAFAIRRTTKDALQQGKPKQYSYEEWVEFTHLIQFTDKQRAGAPNSDETMLDEDEYGVLNWDWIGENSPMLAKKTEPECVLDRLCEGLIRYLATQEKQERALRRDQDVIEEESELDEIGGDDAADDDDHDDDDDQDDDDAPTVRKESDIGLESDADEC